MKNAYKNYIAFAKIKGSYKYPNIYGYITFKQKNKGVLVTAELNNLPYKECMQEIYGFHIHEGNSCTGNKEDPFANAKSHFSKNNCKHPYHSGDMPPLFGNNGYAYMSFFTNRFNIDDIVNKTIVIHSNFDDLKTQPSGNSGEKIACGIIKRSLF